MKGWKNVKRLSLFMATTLMYFATGCGSEAATETQESAVIETTQQEQTTEETGSVTQGMTYYYYVPNETGDGLTEMKEQIDSAEVEVDQILALLAKGNVLPEGITCSSFNQKEEEGKLTVYASFSSELRDYMLTLKDSQKESVTVAAMTNSFLDNYKADYFRFSVEGANLETENHLYNKPLGYYGQDTEFSEWEGYCYELTDAQMVSDDAMFSATYPQFANVEDAELMERFNQAVISYVEAQKAAAGQGTVMIRYEVTYQDGDFVSVILRGEKNPSDGGQASRFAATFNFDFVKKDLRRLTGSIDIATVIDRLELGTDYELVGESRISLEAFQEYQNSGMNDDFMMLLLDYDFVLGNNALNPSGYSYVDEDEKIVLVMFVPSELGDYVEIKCGTKQ